MSDPIFFAPLRVPVIDERTGLMSHDWIRFFQAMYLRIGGIQALSAEDLQLIGDVNDAMDDGSDIRATADLERALALTDEPPSTLSADLAEFQALSASFSEDPIIARFTAQWDGLTPASGGGTVKFLRADGTWSVPASPAVPVGANPSATVGLTAVNGSAATFLRSDGAPALDVTIAPVWSGVHLFGGTPTATNGTTGVSMGASAGFPEYEWIISTGGTDNKVWDIYSDTTTLHGRVVNDARNGAADWLTVVRSGVSVSSVSLATLKVVGTSGFNNTAPIAKPTVTGSRAANAALASLLTSLANYGLITDSTTV